MRAFWADAQSIYETARQAAQAGSPDCDLAILIGAQGDVHMLDATGWAVPTLMAEYSARAVYRVTREGGNVRLEGRSGSRTCLLASESHAETARQLLAGPMISMPAYCHAGPALIAERTEKPREGIWTSVA